MTTRELPSSSPNHSDHNRPPKLAKMDDALDITDATTRTEPIPSFVSQEYSIMLMIQLPTGCQNETI